MGKNGVYDNIPLHVHNDTTLLLNFRKAKYDADKERMVAHWGALHKFKIQCFALKKIIPERFYKDLKLPDWQDIYQTLQDLWWMDKPNHLFNQLRRGFSSSKYYQPVPPMKHASDTENWDVISEGILEEFMNSYRHLRSFGQHFLHLRHCNHGSTIESFEISDSMIFEYGTKIDVENAGLKNTKEALDLVKSYHESRRLIKELNMMEVVENQEKFKVHATL
jgi:hypothetical protein